MHVRVTEWLRVMRDNGQSEWRDPVLVTIRDKDVNRSISKLSRLVETLEPVQPGSGQSSQDGSRPGPEQRCSQRLPLGERARLSDDHTVTWLLPSPRRHSASNLLLRQVPERDSGAQDSILLVDNGGKFSIQWLHVTMLALSATFRDHQFRACGQPC
jgi:hypothetical protein